MRKNIVALILEKDGLLLIEKRKDTKSSDPGKFVFPGGHVHDNEKLDAAIRREAFEELNIKLLNPKLVYATDFDGPEEKQKLHWYWCNNFEGKMQNNEAEELIWIKPSEADKLTYQVSRDAIDALIKQKKSNSFSNKKLGDIKVLHLPKIRVSSASFAILRDSQGRYGLLINKNRAEKKDVVLAPIGGAIEATTKGIKKLQQLLNLENDSFENGRDLRFNMPGSKANLFRTWFIKRQQRETDPTREIIEELTKENRLLNRKELAGPNYDLSGFGVDLATTTRAGKEGQKTLRLLEIFKVKLKATTITKLEKLANQPNTAINFVTAKEIKAGQTNNGIRIDRISKFLLKPKKTLKKFV